MRKAFLTLAIIFSPGIVLAGGEHTDGHALQIGSPAETEVSRTIEITMKETDEGAMIFEPKVLNFDAGESVKLVIINQGELEHEFVMDTPASIMEHKLLMEEFPEMEHDEPNAVRLQPGETGEILWTFSDKGEFEFACLMLGHYESGMTGTLTVS